MNRRYEKYHQQFARLAMPFAAFEKKFGVSMPKLSMASERAVRARYNHLSLLGRRPKLSKLIAAQDLLDNVQSCEHGNATDACYHRAAAQDLLDNVQSCEHGNATDACYHCAAAEEVPQSFAAPETADAAELFASASASHARLDKKAVEEPMTFAGVLQAWAKGKTSDERLSRAFLRKRPPLSVQRDDPQSIQNFVESISFPVEAALSGKGHFFDGKTVPCDIKVRIGRQMMPLNSAAASDYIISRQMAGKTVFL
jgi:hypothetical protein